MKFWKRKKPQPKETQLHEHLVEAARALHETLANQMQDFEKRIDEFDAYFDKNPAAKKVIEEATDYLAIMIIIFGDSSKSLKMAMMTEPHENSAAVLRSLTVSFMYGMYKGIEFQKANYLMKDIENMEDKKP